MAQSPTIYLGNSKIIEYMHEDFDSFKDSILTNGYLDYSPAELYIYANEQGLTEVSDWLKEDVIQYSKAFQEDFKRFLGVEFENVFSDSSNQDKNLSILQKCIKEKTSDESAIGFLQELSNDNEGSAFVELFTGKRLEDLLLNTEENKEKTSTQKRKK